MLDLNETPNKEYDWNTAFAQGTNELDECPANISSESLRAVDLRIAEEDYVIENLEESKRSEDCEMHSGEMDQIMEDKYSSINAFRSSSRDNLQRKMSMHGGYQFHHNTNQEVMQRRVVQPQEPLGASVIKMNVNMQGQLFHENQIQERVNQPTDFALAVQCENEKHQRLIKERIQAQRKANGLNQLLNID